MNMHEKLEARENLIEQFNAMVIPLEAILDAGSTQADVALPLEELAQAALACALYASDEAGTHLRFRRKQLWMAVHYQVRAIQMLPPYVAGEDPRLWKRLEEQLTACRNTVMMVLIDLDSSQQ